MFENIKTMAGRSKDSVVAMAVKKIVNYKLADKVPDARLEALEIDSKDKNITATITLPDLKEPLTIKALNYTITTKNNRHFLEVANIEKSQEWENHYIDGKRYKIPSEIVKAAEFIL